MPIRQFTDANGIIWRVFDIHPDPASDEVAAMSPELVNGWLLFQCAAQRRRLAPIPTDWELATNEELEALSNAAQRVSGWAVSPVRAAFSSP